MRKREANLDPRATRNSAILEPLQQYQVLNRSSSGSGALYFVYLRYIPTKLC